MSKHNKVNKSNYDQAGRLTPDDMARERMKQGEQTRGRSGEDDAMAKMRERSAERESSRSRTGPEESK
jgi:hypothetical protein